MYRARDTKLDCEVAVKFLPPTFTADPERRARFAREARLLASLNHPHIGVIYGLEEAEGKQPRGSSSSWKDPRWRNGSKPVPAADRPTRS